MSHVEEMPTLSGKRNGWAIKESNMEPIHTRSEKKKAKGSWFELNRAIMEDPAYVKLKLYENRLIHALLLHYNIDDDECFPSLKTIARYVVPNFDVGDTVPTHLCTALKSLEEKGFISKESGGRGRSNRYRLHAPSGTGKTYRAGTGKSSRAGTGKTYRSNSHTTAKLNSHSNSRQKEGRGVSPSEGVKKKVSKTDQRIIKAFLDIGVESEPLIKAALRKKGRDWMDAFLMLIFAKDARGELRSTPAAFAVWGLTTKKNVDLDTTPKPTAGEVREYNTALNGNGASNGHRKKKRKKYRQPVEVMKKSESGHRDGLDYDPLAGQRQGEMWD